MVARLSILIVDDDSSLRTALARVLANAGYNVCTAADGSTALTLSRIKAPDAVLADYRLPDMDGVDLCRKIQSREGNPVAIIITGYPDEAAPGADDSGIKAILTKPLSIADLLSILDRLVRKWEPPAVEAERVGASTDGRADP